jgi:hypothetical protein
LRRVQESEALWSKLDELREKHRLPERTISALFDAAINLRVRNSSYRFTLRGYDEEISNQLATGDLRAMVQAGLLKQQGAKRGTFYQAAEPLMKIATSVRRDRKTLDASSLFAV